MTERIELLLSFAIASILLAGYVVYARVTEPSGGQPAGLGIGSLGLLLMLMTEIVYSLRKRMPWFRAGPLRLWLSFHIITGIIGPWLVLLHTAFTFRGLAGLAMGLTGVVVVSGFVGRYIYTRVRRLERLLERRQAGERHVASLKTAQRWLRWWHRFHVPLGLALFTTIAIHVGASIYFGALAR